MRFKKLYDYDKLGIFKPLENDTVFVEVCEYGLNNKLGISLPEALKKGYYMEWSMEKIKRAFSFGNGNMKDFIEYAKLNKNYCLFLEV